MFWWTLSLALAGDLPTAPMAGCWTGGIEGVLTATETWLGPTGDVMAGVLLGVDADGRATWEQLRIEADADGWVMVVLPKGQAETRFRLTSHGEGRWVFANPAHDFPQRIVYAREGERMTVTADAETKDGERKGFSLAYRRCAER